MVLVGNGACFGYGHDKCYSYARAQHPARPHPGRAQAQAQVRAPTHAGCYGGAWQSSSRCTRAECSGDEEASSPSTRKKSPP